MTLPCHRLPFHLLNVKREESTPLRIVVQTKRDHARCPGCRTVSRSVNSRYHRRPVDLPKSGQEARLTLAIQRFRRHDPACARQTFAGRLPRLLDRYAQRTSRLADAQVRTALAESEAPDSMKLRTPKSPSDKS